MIVRLASILIHIEGIATTCVGPRLVTMAMSNARRTQDVVATVDGC